MAKGFGHTTGARMRGQWRGLYFPATLLATFLAILSRFNPDTVTIGYSVEEKSRFNPDTATLGYSVEGFFFPAILSRFNPDTATLGYSVEGFYFPAILSRFNPDTATLGYSVEGFYFLAILSRHCHPCTECFYFPAILSSHCHPCRLALRASIFQRFYPDTAMHILHLPCHAGIPSCTGYELINLSQLL